MNYDCYDRDKALGLINVSLSDPERVASLAAFVLCVETRDDLNGLRKRLGRDPDAKALCESDRNAIRGLIRDVEDSFRVMP